jgi:hypothetical protein
MPKIFRIDPDAVFGKYESMSRIRFPEQTQTDSKYRFFGSCASSSAQRISKIRDFSKQVTYKTVRRHIPDIHQQLVSFQVISADTSYSDVENSAAIQWYKSKHRGYPCYFATWAGYELIWEINRPTFFYP